MTTTTTSSETETKYIAFHGKASIKEKYVNRMRAHLKADQIVQGATGSGGKGCAVWCTFDKYDKNLFPIELGFPMALAYLDENIFESAKKGEWSRTWPLRFLEAPLPGADLTHVPHRFAIWLLTSPDSLYQQILQDGEAKTICTDIAALYRRFVDGDRPAETEWQVIVNRASAASEKAWGTYLALALARARDLAVALARARDLDLAVAVALARARDLAVAVAVARDLAVALARARARDLREKFLVLAAEKLLTLMAEAPVS
jgi:hypothetical protein